MHTATPIPRTARSELRALLAIARKEWLIFRRYPSWILVFLIWPVLYPCGYIFAARALGGPHGAAIAAFHQLTGTSDYLSFIVVGSTMYMWLNLTLWDVGLHLRNEQLRGTLESNWLCPIPRISIMLGSSLTKLATALVFAGDHGGRVPPDLRRGYRAGQSAAGAAHRAAGQRLDLRHRSGVWQPGAALPRGECPGLPRARSLPGLLRHHLSAAGTPCLDADRGGGAAPHLRDPRHPCRHAERGDACRLESDLAALGICALVWPALGYAAFVITERQARRTGALGPVLRTHCALAGCAQ